MLLNLSAPKKQKNICLEWFAAHGCNCAVKVKAQFNHSTENADKYGKPVRYFQIVFIHLILHRKYAAR